MTAARSETLTAATRASGLSPGDAAAGIDAVLRTVPGTMPARLAARPAAWVTGDGLVVMSDGRSLCVGFGVRTCLTADARLLETLADVNQRSPFGHLWLVDGADERHWSLVWAVRIPFGWLTRVTLQRCIYTCVGDHARLLADAERLVADCGGRPYRHPTRRDPEGRMSALLLLEQIG